MLGRRIWMMSLIGLMRNGFRISKFRSVGAFMMFEHLRLVIFGNIGIICRGRLMMAVLWRRRCMMAVLWRRRCIMAVLGRMVFRMPILICWLIVAILWWRRRLIMAIALWRRFIVVIIRRRWSFIMAITWWRWFIVAIFRRRWWFIMAITWLRRRFIMAIARGLSILFYVVSERWSVH